MQSGSYYDDCSDEPAMGVIRRNENRISDADWREVYRQMLDDLCPAPEPEAPSSE